MGRVKLQIVNEGAAATFSELTAALELLPKHQMHKIYTNIEPKFANYIRDFANWKRERQVNTQLISTKATSFEASMLKIKEYVKNGRIVFPFGSEIRVQLASFAKESLKDEVSLYAVRALAVVLWAFDRRKGEGGMEVVPKIEAWW